MEVRTASTRNSRVRGRIRRRRPFSERFDQQRTGGAPAGTPYDLDGAVPDTELCHLVFEPYEGGNAVIGFL